MSEVLVVDDEKQTRDLISIWLRAAGHTVSEAPDAESALEVLKDKPIAVMTIDKDMPGNGGVWLVEQVQQAYPAIAMLLASGDDQIPPRVSLSRGIQGYLVKPLKRELVVGAVADALAWHTVAAKQETNKPAVDPIDSWLQGRAGRPPKSDEQA
jgi:DNA-binding NtrC family response regulator